ncbi:four helix bundle protein [Mariniflexile sp.]|uniref:four helix bundle protein n=1 Tax=Mariniflexile sp. TaxID=1979402 RepID=UPI003564AD2C
MNNYRELKIWQKSMDLVEKTYILNSTFPSEEKFGLISQIQRCAVAVPSNIAEGAGRNSNKEFRNFLGIANGSLNELATQLELSVRIGYLKETNLHHISNLITEIQKMNFTLIQKLSNI